MDSLATESCHLADRLATKLFFEVDNAGAAGPNVIVQGAWQSLSVQDARPEFGRSSPVNHVCE